MFSFLIRHILFFNICRHKISNYQLMCVCVFCLCFCFCFCFCIRNKQFINMNFSGVCFIDALLIIGLPDGPTAHFKLSKLVLHKDVKVCCFLLQKLHAYLFSNNPKIFFQSKWPSPPTPPPTNHTPQHRDIKNYIKKPIKQIILYIVCTSGIFWMVLSLRFEHTYPIACSP